MHCQQPSRASSCSITMINKWFNNKHPKKGHAYAVTTGCFVGEMLVFVEKQKEEYRFISIPKNINRVVPVEKFELGLNQGIVDPVEQIDRQVCKLLFKQYEYNRKQPAQTK
jgi:hypothetical protein